MADRREFKPRIDVRFRLERDGAGQQSAVELGQHDVHGQVGRRQAAAGLRPGLARAAGQHDLQHRNIGSIEYRGIVLTHRREGGGVEDDCGPMGFDQARELALDSGILEAAHGQAERCQAVPLQRSHQGGDRLDVGCQQVGAVEDHECDRVDAICFTQHGERADGDRRMPRLVAAQSRADQPQRLAQIVRASLAKEAIEQDEIALRHRGHRSKPRVGAVVARQGGEQDTVVARQVGDALQAVAPVVQAAEAAHDHGFRLGDDALQVKIDRHRMAQPLQTGQSQRRQQPGVSLPGRSKRRQIGVREGEHDDFGRRVAKIDGNVDLVQTRKLGREHVHDQPRIRAWIAALSRPASPITTRRPCRGAPSGQRLSNWCWMRAPTPCTSNRIGLPLMSTKPFTRRMSWAAVALAIRSIRVCGDSKAGRPMMKVSKSSWSCSSSRS